MWVYNAGNTRDYCAQTCLKFRAEKRPNNGPAPECTLDDCLDCDETESGPLFAQIAARTRRRSGLISKIARPCEDILFVDHQNPCDVVQGVTREFEQGDICQLKQPVEETECVVYQKTLGLESYEAPHDGSFLNLGFLSKDEYETSYGKCKRYSIRHAEEGFWLDVSNILGGAWMTAKFSALIGTIIGTLMWIFVWTACCVAYPKNFWLACTAIFALCGVLEFMTLAFLASDVCNEEGCVLVSAAYIAIAAGILWFITAGLCWKTASLDLANAYTPVSYDICITEYTESDGTVITEKVTTRSNGTRVIERTALIKRKEEKESEYAKHVESGIIATKIMDEDVEHSGHNGESLHSAEDEYAKHLETGIIATKIVDEDDEHSCHNGESLDSAEDDPKEEN